MDADQTCGRARGESAPIKADHVGSADVPPAPSRGSHRVLPESEGAQLPRAPRGHAHSRRTFGGLGGVSGSGQRVWRGGQPD